jgi:hypothetical protein
MSPVSCAAFSASGRQGGTTVAGFGGDCKVVYGNCNGCMVLGSCRAERICVASRTERHTALLPRSIHTSLARCQGVTFESRHACQPNGRSANSVTLSSNCTMLRRLTTIASASFNGPASAIWNCHPPSSASWETRAIHSPPVTAFRLAMTATFGGSLNFHSVISIPNSA